MIGFKKLALLISFVVFVLFVVFVVNQTYQVVQLAEKISVDFSVFVFYFLLLLYLIILTVPLYLFFTMPATLKLPEEADGREYREYMKKLKKRLRKNKNLKGELSINSDSEVRVAIERLNELADKEIGQTATQVFVTTTLSQSGRVDTLIVLFTLTKSIYRIAKIYNQRPGVSEMMLLYSNTFATAFIAYGLEEVNIDEYVEPFLETILPSSVLNAAGSIPGLGKVSDMLFDGLINAYLVLRVGIIAKEYCGSLVKPERRGLRKTATVRAGKLLLEIMNKTGKDVSLAVLNGDRKSVV